MKNTGNTRERELTNRNSARRWWLAAGLMVSLGSFVTAPALGEPEAGATKTQPADKTSDKKVEKNAAGEPVNADTKKVYVVNLRGSLGRNVSATPMKAVMADIKKTQPDMVVLRMDMAFSASNEEYNDFAQVGDKAFNQLDLARQLSTMFTDDLVNDPSWTKKPQVVMWVRKALGPAAFMPFSVHDLYYTSDALHGGIGGLEMVGTWAVDHRVAEKMQGIVSARARGLAALGGHDPRLLRAMSEYRYKLSYNLQGGKPEFFEDYSGEFLLKEDAFEEGQEARRDKMEDVARHAGNDLLTVNAEKAQVLGLSKGTADTLDAIMSDYGWERNYQVVEGRSGKIFENWSREVSDAEQNFYDLWDEFNRIQVDGASKEERNQQRGRQLGVLRKIKSSLDRYREAINPRRIRGAPDDWASNIEIMMEQIKQQMRVDR